MTVVCTKCGSEARKSMTSYGPRHDCCGLWSWGNKPLADRETHEARKAAHVAFDLIWHRRMTTRGDAYRRLQAKLGLSSDACHMAVMDAATARRVPAAAASIRNDLLNEKTQREIALQAVGAST